jgi:hypothetical protein
MRRRNKLTSIDDGQRKRTATVVEFLFLMFVEEGSSGEGDVSLTLLPSSTLDSDNTENNNKPSMLVQFFSQVLSDVVSYLAEYGLLQYVSSDIQVQIEQFHQLINANDVVIVTKNGNLSIPHIPSSPSIRLWLL